MYTNQMYLIRIRYIDVCLKMVQHPVQRNELVQLCKKPSGQTGYNPDTDTYDPTKATIGCKECEEPSVSWRNFLAILGDPIL